jgi:hypothetical protein
MRQAFRLGFRQATRLVKLQQRPAIQMPMPASHSAMLRQLAFQRPTLQPSLAGSRLR